MDLDDVIDEMETASGMASDAKDYVESAIDQLKGRLEEINQLSSDWKEYLEENVDQDELFEYVIDAGYHSHFALNSKEYEDKQRESDQIQKVYWEEVQVNNLARALMFAAFSQERADRGTDWVDPILEEAAREEARQSFAESLKSDLRAGLVRADEADAKFAKRDKLDRLWLVMKRVQSEIEELRGDA